MEHEQSDDQTGWKQIPRFVKRYYLEEITKVNGEIITQTAPRPVVPTVAVGSQFLCNERLLLTNFRLYFQT